MLEFPWGSHPAEHIGATSTPREQLPSHVLSLRAERLPAILRAALQPLAQDGAAQAGRRDPTAAGRDAEARPAPGCCRPGRAGPRSHHGSYAAAHLPRPAGHQQRGAAGLRGRPQPHGRRLGVHRAGGAPRRCRGTGMAGPGVPAACLCSACSGTRAAPRASLVLEAGSAPARCLGLPVLAWEGEAGSRAAGLWASLGPVFGCSRSAVFCVLWGFLKGKSLQSNKRRALVILCAFFFESLSLSCA